MEELKRIVLDQETDEDRVAGISLRPQTLADFVGQHDLVDNIKVAVAAARHRNEPLEHMLFSGPPGLGKTSLAHIIAHEMNARITVTSGPAIERAGDFIGILTNLASGDVLFIDEIHRMSKTVEEFLYPAMENYKIDFIVDKGPYAKTINFNLKPFTLIGATTRSGLLATPLRDRFGISYHLDFYPADELAVIVAKAAEKLSIELGEKAAFEIAKRSRGTPRIANRLLRRVRDFAQVKFRQSRITVEIVEASMATLKVDGEGLDDLDRRYLRLIQESYDGGPVGIEALAATMNEESDTLADVVEPFLLKKGFLRRTSRGREITDKAKKYLCSAG